MAPGKTHKLTRTQNTTITSPDISKTKDVAKLIELVEGQWFDFNTSLLRRLITGLDPNKINHLRLVYAIQANEGTRDTFTDANFRTLARKLDISGVTVVGSDPEKTKAIKEKVGLAYGVGLFSDIAGKKKLEAFVNGVRPADLHKYAIKTTMFDLDGTSWGYEDPVDLLVKVHASDIRPTIFSELLDKDGAFGYSDALLLMAYRKHIGHGDIVLSDEDISKIEKRAQALGVDGQRSLVSSLADDQLMRHGGDLEEFLEALVGQRLHIDPAKGLSR